MRQSHLFTLSSLMSNRTDSELIIASKGVARIWLEPHGRHSQMRLTGSCSSVPFPSELLLNRKTLCFMLRQIELKAGV